MSNPLQPVDLNEAPPPGAPTGFLDAGKKSASLAFQHLKAHDSRFESLPPEKIFEIAFCMGDAHGVEFSARVCDNIMGYTTSAPDLSKEAVLHYVAAGRFIGENLRTLSKT